MTDTLIRYSIKKSPVGDLLLVASDAGLRGIYTASHRQPPSPEAEWLEDDAALRPVGQQLEAYFNGELREFDLALDPQGTPFQQEVWKLLIAIPYGQTTTYGELARRLGNPNASRAVGAANGRNPISIVVPCHRVIGKSGALTGYAGGVDVKRTLLDLEALTAIVGGTAS